MPRTFACLTLALVCLAAAVAPAADGNRLAYLDGPLDPYYPHRDFPKLTTPQWVGEEGVECVVTLAIDDMRDSSKYETFLRPILNRLKAIDGRAALSIMSCRVDPADLQLQAWLKEGLSIEVHTYDHPCPCLQEGGLAKAKETYDKCVDLMSQIPGNKPVAFRMPCCDSKNTPSPRFWAEVFNKTTEKGNFLQIDSSVFNIITNKDKSLPKEISELPDGTERFRRYVPFANFVNTIEDYPYPYVIGGMCWEFPCVVPSDWSANHVQQPNNPDTVRDWKLALDACVLKQGTFNLVFHPHGWIRNDQIIELIDHAVTKHGKKVKFLNFRECAERLNTNLLSNLSIRNADGSNSRVDVLEQNRDGYVDVVFPPKDRSITRRLWQAANRSWLDVEDHSFRNYPRASYLDRATKLIIDIDGDGETEAVWIGDDGSPKVGESAFINSPVYWPLQFSLPEGVKIARIDSSLRFIDINNDGKLDCLFSNAERYSLHLFKDMKEGWAIKVIEGVRGKEGCIGPVIPPFVRADGTNNGAWFHSGALWLMNEDTWRLPDNVFKLTFAEMLGKAEAGGQKSEGGKNGAGCCGNETVGDEAAIGSVLGTKYPVLGTQCLVPSTTQSKRRDNNSPRPAVQLVSQPQAPSPEPRAPAFDSLEMTLPRSPEESLKALHVHPGFKVELVAAEPLIVDPVAFDWGPDGRLWVVEMRDYPNGITWKKEGDEFGKPGGRVKVLTDTDGDGKYDKATVFLDEIPFPTGIKVWRKGILVTAAPEIFYAEDKDGDDKADERKVLYLGFGEGNQQHRVNGLRWGLDNWLYVGNGDSGGVIKSLGALNPLPLGEGGRRPGEGLLPTANNPHPGPLPKGEGVGTEVNVNGRDLRIRPDTGELDPTSGNTQFGRERDDWGNWFGGNNSDPMWHYVLDDYYLRRNPNATYPPVKKDVSVVPGASPVYPRSKTQKRFNDDNKANRYTSACSPIIYRDDLLGPEYYGNMFVCEPVHNLVGHEIVSPLGATFTSKRAADEQMSEFLASEDNWFRPSMCRTGPDGALWVADMYRFVIEHPKWIPPAAQQKLDLRAGDDKGRIYRIYPDNMKPRPIARLDKLDTAGLVAALDSPNGPQRDLAQQMLIWRGDKAAADPLQKLAGGSKRLQTRLQALCTLDGMAALDPIGLVILSSDTEPAVRRHVLRLSEPWLGKNQPVTDSVSLLAFDEDITVRMQAAYSLGAWNDDRAASHLATLMLKSSGDPYVIAAALSSIKKENVGIVLRSVLAGDDAAAKEKLVERLLALAAAMGQDAAVGQALAAILRPQADGSFAASQFATLAAAADALQRRKSKLAAVLDDGGKQRLSAILAQARSLVDSSGDQTLPLKLVAIALLARGLDDRDDADVTLLASLLAPQKQPELRAVAVTALARTGRSNVAQLLLIGWAAHSPSLRSQILDALASREDWSLAVLDAIEKGQIASSQLDARRRQQFLTARSSAVRQRAQKVLTGAVDPNRQKLVETYLPVVAKGGGDVTRGKAVYAKRCGNCHKLEGTGFAVGPDLAALTGRPADYLLTSILDPNRAVEDRYLEYVVLTTDGRQLNGILLEETGASLTLAAPEGKQVVISRSDLDQMKSSGKSLMPEGVEKDVSPAEMADLLAYLKSTARPPKVLALNKPEVVQAFNDGSIRLFATSCRAYGSTIKMEETYKALGWWNSQDDYCAWSFDVPAGGAGEYRITLEYSCADNSAGNTAVVEVADQSLSGQVVSSGGWDKYRGWALGSVTLPEGRNEIVVRSSGPLKRALFDLGGVKLVPAK